MTYQEAREEFLNGAGGSKAVRVIVEYLDEMEKRYGKTFDPETAIDDLLDWAVAFKKQLEK